MESDARERKLRCRRRHPSGPDDAETPFTLEGVPVILRGFRADLTCSRTWVSQTIREDVSLGHYNHITRRLTIPSQQFWSMGVIDQEAWSEIDISGERLENVSTECVAESGALAQAWAIPNTEPG